MSRRTLAVAAITASAVGGAVVLRRRRHRRQSSNPLARFPAHSRLRDLTHHAIRGLIAQRDSRRAWEEFGQPLASADAVFAFGEEATARAIDLAHFLERADELLSEERDDAIEIGPGILAALDDARDLAARVLTFTGHGNASERTGVAQ